MAEFTRWLVTPDSTEFLEQDVFVYPGSVGNGTFAPVMSQVNDLPAYGGTPSDASIKEAIKYAIDTKGLEVYFQPKLFMDIASGNSLTNPLDGTSGQPTYPWRGEITVSATAIDRTASARTEVETFFGTDETSDFTIADGNVIYDGTEYSYRTFILHYALLCSEAIKTLTAKSKFKAFYIGGELASLTKIRDETGAYPAVEALTQLVTDVKSIFTAASQTVEVSYVAHWTEYHSHQPKGDPDYGNVDLLIQGPYADGSTTFVDKGPDRRTVTNSGCAWSDDVLINGENTIRIDAGDYLQVADSADLELGSGPGRITVLFNLDALVSGKGHVVLGKNNYTNGNQSWTIIINGTTGQIYFEWSYDGVDIAGELVLGTVVAGTTYQVDVLIDGSGNITGYLNGVLSGNTGTLTSPMFNGTAPVRMGLDGNGSSGSQFAGHVGPVRISSETTAVSVQTDFFPEDSDDIIYNMDPLWDTCDFVAIANFMPMSDWRDGDTHADYGDTNDSYGNPRSKQIYSLDYLKGQIEGGEYWDYEYLSSENRDSQTRTALTNNFAYRIKDIVGWWENSHYNIIGGVTSGTASDWTAESSRIVFAEFGIPSIDKGTNEPDALYKRGPLDTSIPNYSDGNNDIAIQKVGIQAVLEYWGANAPVGMLDTNEIFINNWDVRPYPEYPSLKNVWSDSDTFEIGLGIMSKIEAVFVEDIIHDVFTDAGVSTSYIDFSLMKRPVTQGFLVDAIGSARDIIGPIEYTFHIESFESEGKIKVKAIDLNESISLTLDDMVVGEKDATPITFERKLDSELPIKVTVSYASPEKDYTVSSVSRSKAFGSSKLQEQKNLTIALGKEQAIALAETKVQQAWIERTGVSFKLPKNQIKIDPGDIVNVTVNDIDYVLKVVGINFSENLELVCKTFSDDIFDNRYTGIIPEGALSSGARDFFGSSFVIFMNLPLFSIQEAFPWAPRVVAYQNPFPASVNIYESIESDNILLNELTFKSQFGYLEEALVAGNGVYDVIDEGTELIVNVADSSFQPTSVTENLARGTSNRIALRTDSQSWEILSFVNAELVATNQYKLTRLVRGQFGTTNFVGLPASAGALVVFLDNSSLEPVNLEEYRKFETLYYRYGPSTVLPGDDLYKEIDFTGWGVGLRPYPVTNIEFFPDGTDMNVTWIRQTRASGLSFDAETIPLNEDQELYEIDVYNDTTLVETLTSTTPNVTITSYPANLRVEIYQMSLAVGRGRKAEKTYG